MTRIPRFVSALGLSAAFFASASISTARPDYTRRTKQECAYCHPPGGWHLNDAGTYFRDHRNLNGYVPAPDASKSPKQKDQNQGHQKPTAQNEKSKSQNK
jgi:hypothetical protein